MSNLDFSFADRYDNEMSKFGSLRQSSVKRINDDVMRSIDDVGQSLFEIDIEKEAAGSTAFMNDQLLAREGFTRKEFEEGRLPAYMENQMHDESDRDRDFDGEAKSLQESFFDAVYRVDPVLTDKTREALGPDYAAFVEERDMETARQMSGAPADARHQNGARATLVDREAGESHLSLVDDYGQPTNDPYAFDEFD